jgi:hypothetical protein
VFGAKVKLSTLICVGEDLDSSLLARVGCSIKIATTAMGKAIATVPTNSVLLIKISPYMLFENN